MVDLKEESQKRVGVGVGGAWADGPRVVPCLHGRELNLRPEVAMTGLAAIALKGPAARPPPPPSVLRARDRRLSKRNSFWDLHRPELSKLAWAAAAADADAAHVRVRQCFHVHSAFQAQRWARLDRAAPAPDAEADADADPDADPEAAGGPVRELQERREEPPEAPELPVARRCVPLTDEDLPPEVRVHRSSGALCVAACVGGGGIGGGGSASGGSLRRTASAAEAEAVSAAVAKAMAAEEALLLAAAATAPAQATAADAAPDGEVELRGGLRALLRPRDSCDDAAAADRDLFGAAEGTPVGDATAPVHALKNDASKGDASKGDAPKGDSADAVDSTGDRACALAP